MAPPKGKVNNPYGRPPKSRALTDMLFKSISKTVEVNGKHVSGKRVMADLVAQVLTTGRLQFPGDTEQSVVSVKDWMEFVKWAYQYLEPPVTKNQNQTFNFDPSNFSVTELEQIAAGADPLTVVANRLAATPPAGNTEPDITPDPDALDNE
jgi:hypothetical protein